MKNFKKISFLFMIIFSVFSTANIIFAIDTQGNYNIVEIEEKILESEKRQSYAHNLAESARNLGFDENHEIILKAQEIWRLEKENIQNYKKVIKNIKESSRVYIGDFKLTAYCPCYSCSEGYGSNTASGVRATEGVTIAADKRILPLGTKVYIEGVGERIVQDVGGAIKGNKIDIYVSSHDKCFNANFNKISKVYIIR